VLRSDRFWLVCDGEISHERLADILPTSEARTDSELRVKVPYVDDFLDPEKRPWIYAGCRCGTEHQLDAGQLLREAKLAARLMKPRTIIV